MPFCKPSWLLPKHPSFRSFCKLTRWNLDCETYLYSLPAFIRLFEMDTSKSSPQLIPTTSGMITPRPKSKRQAKFMSVPLGILPYITVLLTDFVLVFRLQIVARALWLAFPQRLQPMEPDNADVHHGDPRRQSTSSRSILIPNTLLHCSLLASIPCWRTNRRGLAPHPPCVWDTDPLHMRL